MSKGMDVSVQSEEDSVLRQWDEEGILEKVIQVVGADQIIMTTKNIKMLNNRKKRANKALS